jgi:adenylate cyclase
MRGDPKLDYLQIRRQRVDRVVLGLLIAAAVTSVLYYFTHVAPALLRLEHWTADWRTALLSDRAPAQHSRLALVLINEETLAPYPYNSPIDRSLLARLVRVIDQLGATAIGLDLIFLKATEPAKDRDFEQALRDARTPVIMAAADSRVELTDSQRQFQRDFLARTTRPAGYANLNYDRDQVVRQRAGPADGNDEYLRSFSSLMAATAGAIEPDPRARIAWLRKPIDSDTFFQLSAHALLDALKDENSALGRLIRAQMTNRLVLIGGAMGEGDLHRTPLFQEDGSTVHGLVIHAQMIAELLDDRSVKRLPDELVWPLAYTLAFAGYLLGWHMRSYGIGWWVTTLPTALLIGLDLLIFWKLRIILPFSSALAAWLIGGVCGFALGRTIGALAQPTRRAQ